MAVDDNDNTGYQLNEDEETVYEPEEEHYGTGSDEPDSPKKKPSRKKAIIAIIIIAVVLFFGYKIIHSIGGKKELKPISVPSVTKTTAAITPAPIATSASATKAAEPVAKTDGTIGKIKQLQQQSSTAIDALKQQQQSNQAALQKLHQKLSNINERIESIQNLTQSTSSKIQQITNMQQQARRIALARRSRIRAANARALRRKKSYFVQAVIPGRAWLRGADGSAITISKGDNIPGYGKVISIDPYSGTVVMSSGIKLYYGINN